MTYLAAAKQGLFDAQRRVGGQMKATKKPGVSRKTVGLLSPNRPILPGLRECGTTKLYSHQPSHLDEASAARDTRAHAHRPRRLRLPGDSASLGKRLVIPSLVFLMVGFLGAGLACGDYTTSATVLPARAALQTAITELTTTTVTAIEVTPSEASTAVVSDPEVQKRLDQLAQAAHRAAFAVYYLGAAYRDATMAGVMAGNTDATGAFQRVDMVYRHEGGQDRLVVYLSQYDPALRLDLKKPLSDWTLVRKVETNGRTDVIYRSDKDKALLYVAQRGSTEITLMGHTGAGYMTEEQLIDIAPLLVPEL